MKKLSLNKLNKLLNELSLSLEKKFKNNFTGLVLFGSYAKGLQKDYSDLDILLTFKELPESKYEKTALISDFLLDFEEKYNININQIVSIEKNLKKCFLLADISEYAKILIDKNKIILKLFNSIKKEYKLGYLQKITRENNSQTLIIGNV